MKEPVELWTDIDGHNGLVRIQCNFITVDVSCIRVKHLSGTDK